jgi:hypothetical protein
MPQAGLLPFIHTRAAARVTHASSIGTTTAKSRRERAIASSGCKKKEKLSALKGYEMLEQYRLPDDPTTDLAAPRTE